MAQAPYRLVTRSDFDGLACAVLLRELALVDEVVFVHAADVRDGKVAIGARDILANLPWVAGAHLVFDHRATEALRNPDGHDNYVIDVRAASTVRVMLAHFGAAAAPARLAPDMLAAVDKAGAARFTREDILEPRGWVLLNCVMDARTGLGRFRQFRVSNYQLMQDLIDQCRGRAIDHLLQLPDVQERVALYHEQAARAREQIQRCAALHGNLVVVDLRGEETIWAVNRFMVYALFPDANVSLHVMWGLRRQNTVFAAGKSILDRSSRTDVGHLMLEFGGGGQQGAGSCQIDNAEAQEVLEQLIRRITQDG